MRIATYVADGGLRPGIVVDDTIHDAERLSAAIGTPLTTTRAILAAGPEAWSALDAAVRDAADGTPLDAVRLGPPVPDPPKIICLGLNYRDHAAETGMAEPSAPMIFAKFANSLVGPVDDVVVPAVAGDIDYEVELAVVIGRPTRDVAAADALDHVAGVTVLNDVSSRSLQLATSQWGAGKAIDTFAPCGPVLVTLDEIGDIQDLRLRTRVDGEVVQDGNTREMIFPVATTIEFLSRFMTLEAGDIIATGTPAGVGMSRTPQRYLEIGAVVETEIEGIGTLRNTIVSR